MENKTKTVTINITSEEDSDHGGLDIKVDTTKVEADHIKTIINDALQKVEGVEVECVFT